jgi:hypothetical protein
MPQDEIEMVLLDYLWSAFRVAFSYLPFLGQPASVIDIARHSSSQSSFDQALPAQRVEHGPVRFVAADLVNKCSAFVSASGELIVCDSAEHLLFFRSDFHDKNSLYPLQPTGTSRIVNRSMAQPQ